MRALIDEFPAALRRLRKHPGFCAIVILTLSLGIGANTAIFSFVYAVLLRPFPYPAPGQLVRINTVLNAEGGRETLTSTLDIEDWSRESQTLSAVGGYITFDIDLRGDGPAETIRMCQINEGAIRAVGVAPVLGRLFDASEDRSGGEVRKALISYEMWMSRFGGDRSVIGKSLSTSITNFTIIGVMPKGFGFPDTVQVWTPAESWYAIQKPPLKKERHYRYYSVLGRMRSGVSVGEASAELNNVAASLERQYPKENKGVRVRLRTLREAETGELRPYLLLVSGAAGLVLCLCCANVAGLLLARGFALRREFGVRAALGASRSRLMVASLTESLVLALVGGLCGLTLAYGSVRLLLPLIPFSLPAWMRISVDLPALAFALMSCFVVTMLFGAAPALLLSGSNLSTVMRDSGRNSTGAGNRFRSVLVAAEICVTLLLLVGAGLLTETFVRLRTQETGFRSDGLLIVKAINYRTGTRVERATALSQFHDQVIAKLQALPGVSLAAATNFIPYTRTTPERNRGRLRVKGVSGEEMRLQLPINGADISPKYLEIMNIPLVAGRYFDARDTPTSPMVVIVNERAAQTLWPGRNAVGQELYFGTNEPSSENPYTQVVGVVKNVRTLAGEANDGLEVYYPYTQYPLTGIYYVLRTAGSPSMYAAGIREAIQSVDRNAGVVFTKTMNQIMDESLWQRRLWSVLVGAFGTLALILAGVGIYGLLAFLVKQRTREIGVRMALGAKQSSIMALILGQGGRLLAAGVVAGLIAGFAANKSLSALLFGVTGMEPATLVGAVAVLSVVALVACYIPARRATSIDPLIALREE